MAARNEPCPCGSGKKYKKCCMRNDSLPEDERGLLDPSQSVTDEIKAATDRMTAEEGYTAEAGRQLLAVERRRRRKAFSSGLGALAWMKSWAGSA